MLYLHCCILFKLSILLILKFLILKFINLIIKNIKLCITQNL